MTSQTALFGAFCVLMWASSFTLSKLALATLDPWNLAFWRWLWATVFFALYLPLSGQWSETVQAWRRTGWRLAWLGLIGVSLLYALQNVGLTRTTAINSSLIMNSIGLFTAILGVVWLGERPGRRIVGGLALAFSGVVIVVGQGALFSVGASTFSGDLLTLAAALCAALYSILGKPIVAHTPPAVVAGLAAGFGALFLLPWALWQGLTLPHGIREWALLLILGVGSGALANLAWWQVLRSTDASRAGLMLFLIPVFGSLVAVAALGETLTWQTIAGAVCVLGGLRLARV